MSTLTGPLEPTDKRKPPTQKGHPTVPVKKFTDRDDLLAYLTAIAAAHPGIKLAVSYLRVSTTGQADKDYDAEGFSIPAQREANQRTAENLDAMIVLEFVDRGQSAKSADRPELKDMLKILGWAHGLISYAIVHKVDRLARSREDDVAINIAIRQAGAQLVSSTENIDDTPSGKLLHGIMATIAEFYSANLATEAKKGMRQKAKIGGTATKAPIGYLHVRERIDGREIRTIALDPERAPLMKWAFTAYATGDWTLASLEMELARRGLRYPATAKMPERPVSYQALHKLLTNRYYLGKVTFEGVEYEGRHPALVDEATFEMVGAIMRSRSESNEKPQKHPHYLKGTVYCGQCGGRLGITNAKNRHGTVYPYFYCTGRSKKSDCTQKAVAISKIEQAVADYWHRVQLTAFQRAEVRQGVLSMLGSRWEHSGEEIAQQERRIEKLEREQTKLLQAHYADAIPLDLLKTEQARILRELMAAKKVISDASVELETVERDLDEALALCADPHRLYISAPQNIRRMLNQDVFHRLWIVGDEVKGSSFTPTYARLHSGSLAELLTLELAHDSEEAQQAEDTLWERLRDVMGVTGYMRPLSRPDEPLAAAWDDLRPWLQPERPWGALPLDMKNPGSLTGNRGSNINTLVELRGFEPLTPSMRTRCATGLRHSPNEKKL